MDNIEYEKYLEERIDPAIWEGVDLWLPDWEEV